MRRAAGSAARGEDLAWIELEVSGRRIVAARGDGPGVADVCGLVRGRETLAAAAVEGEPLALDALHDALGPVVSGARDERRVAVAMSGGVDSAVALLHAESAG